MKAILVLLAAALALPATASAKFRITLTLTDPSPAVGEVVQAAVRVNVPHDDAGTLRLVAIPPGVDTYAAIRAEARYGVELVEGPDGWTATLRFRRAGRWLLVVPNWGAPGYAIPPPVIRTIDVASSPVPVRAGAGTRVVPWIAIGMAVAGAGALLAFWVPGKARRSIPTLLGIVVASLALPAAAQAKGITGVTLCGPEGCESARLTGFGHRGPTGEAAVAPPPGPFYRLSFGEGDEDAWFGHYYEPSSGLVAFDSFGSMTWRRPDPAVAELAERLARKVAPFPGPVVSEVRIGTRVVREGAASYLALYELEGERAEPGEAPGVGIRFYGATVEDPWTASDLVYYPEDDVLVLGSGRYVKVPANIAADIEAARSLGAGDPIVIPWLAVAVALVGGAALVALWAGRTRGAVRGTGRSGAAPRGAAPVS